MKVLKSLMENKELDDADGLGLSKLKARRIEKELEALSEKASAKQPYTSTVSVRAPSGAPVRASSGVPGQASSGVPGQASSGVPVRASSGVPLRASSGVPVRASSGVPLRASSGVPVRASSGGAGRGNTAAPNKISGPGMPLDSATPLRARSTTSVSIVPMRASSAPHPRIGGVKKVEKRVGFCDVLEDPPRCLS